MSAEQLTTKRAAASRHLPYMRGIDGLRAIAVLSVMLYHSSPDTMIGGFLGVEVFFVISGYLITSLLIKEYLATGTIDLVRFWIRRARRLLPALFVLLGVVIVYAALFLPDQAARMRGDVIAAVAYVTNWQLIVQNVSYFESLGRPPVLRHLWSLAIEEQFYVVWPLAFLAGMTLLRSLKRLAWVTLAVAAGSVVLMWFLFDPLNDPSRVYYGTDTRAAGLLVGVVLAAVWRPWAFRLKATPRGVRVLDGLGVVSLGIVVAFLFFVSEFSSFLYRGGFPLLGLATAGVIAVCAYPRTSVGRVLGNPVFLWLGRRSYGIYLWHWPIFMVTRPDLDIGLDGLSLLALRFGLTFLVAELSYRYVETPIRQGDLAAWLTGMRARVADPWHRMASLPAMTFTAIGLLAVGSIAVQLAAPAVTASDELQAEFEAITATSTTTTTTRKPAEQADASAATTRTVPAPDIDITAIGDSVMLGATPILQEEFGDSISIDAKLNRKLRHAVPIVEELAASGRLGTEMVVVHLGNNSMFHSDDFDALMRVLADHPNVVFFNVNVDRSWEGPVNAALQDGVARWGNATLVDWKAVASGQSDFFREDGVHLATPGMRAYAQLIRDHL